MMVYIELKMEVKNWSKIYDDFIGVDIEVYDENTFYTVDGVGSCCNARNYKSIDGGKTWEKISDKNLSAFPIIDKNNFIAAGSSFFWKFRNLQE